MLPPKSRTSQLQRDKWRRFAPVPADHRWDHFRCQARLDSKAREGGGFLRLIYLSRARYRFSLSKFDSEARLEHEREGIVVFLLIVGAGAWSIDGRLASTRL